jgi:hypothetical protein
MLMGKLGWVIHSFIKIEALALSVLYLFKERQYRLSNHYIGANDLFVTFVLSKMKIFYIQSSVSPKKSSKLISLWWYIYAHFHPTCKHFHTCLSAQTRTFKTGAMNPIGSSNIQEYIYMFVKLSIEICSFTISFISEFFKKLGEIF